MLRLGITVLLGLTCAIVQAEQSIRLDIIRDAWVSAVGAERDGNNGAATRLKTKGIQELSLLDFDPSPLRGRVIRAATLHLNSASKDFLRRATVSSIATQWVEGTGNGYAVQPGSVSFNFAEQSKRPWAWPGSDITAVIAGEGGTVWGFADATAPDADGWQTLAIAPAVLGARVAGISHGLALIDDVGSEYQRDGDHFTYKLLLNRFHYSRDQNRRVAPYLTVTLGEPDRIAPLPPSALAVLADRLPPGEARVSWMTPPDNGPAGIAGFLITANGKPVPQYLVPRPATSGTPVEFHLRDMAIQPGAAVALAISAVDGAGNASAPAMITVAASNLPPAVELPVLNDPPAPAPAPLPTVAGVSVAIIDALDKVHPVTGNCIPAHPPEYLASNHLFSAASRRIRLAAAANEFVDFQVILAGVAPRIVVDLSFDDASLRVKLHRFRHVATKDGPLPDPLVPLTGPLGLPATDEKIPGQTRTAVLAEIYVPHRAATGVRRGTLRIAVGEQTLSIPVELRIWRFELPDILSFIPEMNCYSLPDPPVERAYYRLAQEHRTCLNRLGYNWRGQVHDGCGPAWNGRDFDFSAYDRRFGPLLDGSLFADLPRGPVPVETFYLPLNENWPVPLEANFTGGYWADHAFKPSYSRDLTLAGEAFAKHFAQKSWNRTLAEFYLNNKVYHKGDSWKKSSAPWVFDEPVNTQDFWALRWYGQAFNAGVAAAASPRLPQGDDGHLTGHRAVAAASGIRLSQPEEGRQAPEDRAEGQRSRPTPLQRIDNDPPPNLLFRCDISRPQWQRDLLDGVMGVNVVGGAMRPYARMIADRQRYYPQLILNYGSSNPIEQSNVQPAAWCLDAWSLGADGVLPWQTVGRQASWSNADELSLFYPRPSDMSDTSDVLPSVRLKAYRRGQQDVEYLTILQQTLGAPRWQVQATVLHALPLSGRFSKTSEDDAGRMAYDRVDPAALWALRMRLGSRLDGLAPAARLRWANLRPAAALAEPSPDSQRPVIAR